MTATDRLRALLDERGVEYETDDHMGFSETRWGGTYAFQLAPGAALVMAVTPEQAVQVTLGRGECRDTGEYVSAFECSACGEVYEMWRGPDYCPGCGARVIGGCR